MVLLNTTFYLTYTFDANSVPLGRSTVRFHKTIYFIIDNILRVVLYQNSKVSRISLSTFKSYSFSH